MATDTSTYKLHNTMLRIKDPARTLKFYEFLGMKQIHKIEQPDNKFDLYFLAYDSPQSVSSGKSWTDRQGVLELTHNYGSESNEKFSVNTGNTDPGKGFGHVCISVDAIQACCQRIEDAGYKFQKKLTDGRMKSIAFALDPDGYWVEIISFNSVEKTADVTKTDPASYRFNHSMIRVKDPKASLEFYQHKLGMKLLRTSINAAANFNLYFLGFPDAKADRPEEVSDANGVNPQSSREGILELTWNYGTEQDADFKYHNGNDEPLQGFGHVCLSVDNLEAACARFDQEQVTWKKRLADGRMHHIAFLLDPDGYWIEVIQNEALKSS